MDTAAALQVAVASRATPDSYAKGGMQETTNHNATTSAVLVSRQLRGVRAKEKYASVCACVGAAVVNNRPAQNRYRPLFIRRCRNAPAP